jgi:adenylate cyclase
MWAFMDNVTFDNKGNTVVMVKRRTEHTPPPPETGTKQAQLPAVLGVLNPRDGSAPILLTKSRMTVGRDLKSDIVIRAPSISSHHCLLYTFQGWWYVRDLRSKNGIRINHVSYAEHLLRPGTHLSIGKCEYEVQYEPWALGAIGIEPPIDPF